MAFFLLAAISLSSAQDIPIEYSLGENYSDRYKYSTLLSIESSAQDETLLVRTYYGGFPLRPKGHFIEIYDTDLNLVRDYNYKYAGDHMVDGFVKNGQLYLLELRYNVNKEAYQYVVHQSPLHDFKFTERVLLSVPSKEVANPLAVSKYDRSFGNGFSTAVHFNDARSAFAITVQFREGRDEKYNLYLFGTNLKQRIVYDFTDQITEKNYAFENIAVSDDLKTLYLMGQSLFQKTPLRPRRKKLPIRTGQSNRQRTSDPGVQRYRKVSRIAETDIIKRHTQNRGLLRRSKGQPL